MFPLQQDSAESQYVCKVTHHTVLHKGAHIGSSVKDLCRFAFILHPLCRDDLNGLDYMIMKPELALSVLYSITKSYVICERICTSMVVW